MREAAHWIYLKLNLLNKIRKKKKTNADKEEEVGHIILSEDEIQAFSGPISTNYLLL